MARPYDEITRDAQLALQEFSTDFDAALALGAVDQWSVRLGLRRSSNTIKTTFPLPISAAGYKRRQGDDKLRSLYARSLSITPVEWYDGVSENHRIVEADDFIGWAGEPERIALEAQRLPNDLIAAMLHANPLLDFYRQELPGGSVASTIRLFANNHPVNVLDSSFGTFDNDHAATRIDEVFAQAVFERFAVKAGPNGKPLGMTFDTLLVPSALSEESNEFFQRDVIVLAATNVAGTENVGGVATNNRYKNRVEVVTCPELEDANIVYAMCAAKKAYPWVIVDTGTPEQIVYGYDDAKYKDEGILGVKFILTMGVAAALPQAIERITIG